MFEQWKEKELADIKGQYGKVRLFTYAIVAFMGLSALGSVVMLLDGGGAMELVALAFQLAILAAAWVMGDYKRRFIKPMLSSVEETLPTQGEREAFAREMEEAEELQCPVTAQSRSYPLFLGREYLYFRRPGKSRVVKSRSLRRIKLTDETYTVGRGHVRSCCGVYLYQEEDRPVWGGVFRTEEEAYRVQKSIQSRLSASLELEDQIAYGKTEEGRKEARSAGLRDFLLSALLVAAMYLFYRLVSK